MIPTTLHKIVFLNISHLLFFEFIREVSAVVSKTIQDRDELRAATKIFIYFFFNVRITPRLYICISIFPCILISATYENIQEKYIQEKKRIS